MKLKLSLAAVGLALGLSACGGGGGGSVGVIIDPGYTAWYDVYGRYCGSQPGPGCNFYSNGYKIIDTEDPFFFGSYRLDLRTWIYTDSFGTTRSWVGWGWLSPSGILYNDWGDALNNTDSDGRDFAGDVAQRQDDMVQTAADALKERYQLEASVALNIAHTLNDYALIGRDRARTQEDLAVVARRLSNGAIGMGEVEAAVEDLMLGKTDKRDALYEQVGQVWNATPEMVREMLRNSADPAIAALL